MAERPILFSAPMVRALLAGRKTQTRRLVKPREPRGSSWQMTYIGDGRLWPHVYTRPTLTRLAPAPCPHGQTGDRLWVKETIRRVHPWHGRYDYAEYVADQAPTPLDTWPWKRNVLPSIFCPIGLSRLTLEVTGVRVERVQEISDEDAKAEGVKPTDAAAVFQEGGGRHPQMEMTCRGAFACLWDSINAKRGCSWESNPWVWVVTFKVVENG